MGNFFAELKRRHIYQVAAAYTVVAWVLLQLFNNLTPILKLPDWAGTFVLVLIVGGFPVAILFAWIHQLAPARGVAAQPAPVKSEQGKSLLRGFRSSKGKPSRAVHVVPPAVVSIAVLPFANMSGDPAQEFFSDGMTEEITSALAKVPNLRVVARTSAFQFKSQNRDIKGIGAALHATHLIEGSVRKDGNQVRITAQLIKADDGTHIWTESYNRELRAVFAVQEEIAQAIAASLQMPLGLKQGEHLVPNRSIDPDSYQQFLRAKALVRARGLKSLTEGAALLEQVVARNPNYAPAWALLGFAYASTPNFHPAWCSGDTAELRRLADGLLPKAEAAAQRAIQLDAKHADGYVALAYVQAMRAKLLNADELFLKALELDGYDPDALHFYSLLLAGVGRLKEAIAMRQRVQTLEPFVPNFNANTGYMLWMNGQTGDALSVLKDVPLEYTWRQFFISSIYASLGRYGEAADAIQASPAGIFLPGTVEDAARFLRTAPTAISSPQTLPRLGYLCFVYPHIGASSRVLEVYEECVEAGYSVPTALSFLWHASYAPVRQTERFKAFARKAGLVEYWRAKGWPEFCRPTTGDDFICD